MLRSWLDGTARYLRSHKGYAALAVTTLAGSVGVVLIAFTVVNALWLRPLPLPNASRIVTIPTHVWLTLDAPVLGHFEQVAGQVLSTDVLSELRSQVTVAGLARNLEVSGVTSQYFDVLQLEILGRGFNSADDQVGAEPVAILSDRLWTLVFDRKPEVVGSVIPATPLPLRIVGVAPAGFEGARKGERTDLWVPSQLVPRLTPYLGDAPAEYLPLVAFARLVSGQTAEGVQQLVREKYKGDPALSYLSVVRVEEVFATPSSRSIVIREATSLQVAGGLAVLVLLGSCASLAALVVVHYERRRQEFAVRLALGASQGKLVGQLVSEMIPIASVGLAAAVCVASLGLRAVPTLHLPGGVNLSRLDLSIDHRVLVAALALTLLTLTLAAAFPLVRCTSGARSADLSSDARGTASRSSYRLRQILLGLQACATAVTMLTAVLFVRAVLIGIWVAPGFDVERTMFVKAQVASFVAMTPDSRVRAEERTAAIRDALRLIPGVRHVADGIPPIGREANSSLARPDVIISGTSRHVLTYGKLYGSAETPSALGITILRGRTLIASDTHVQPVPAIISRSLSNRLWLGADPIGQVVQTNMFGGSRQIVGVAEDFAFGSIRELNTPVIVTIGPHLEWPRPNFIVRTADPGMSPGVLDRAVRTAVPTLLSLDVISGRSLVLNDLGPQLLGAWFFSAFGSVGLLLGATTTFGLVAYVVESRRREFGVRLALGAAHRHLVRHTLGSAILPVLSGLILGLFVGAAVAGVLASYLIGLTARDVIAYAITVFTILASATAAAVLGMRPLRRISAGEALRAV